MPKCFVKFKLEKSKAIQTNFVKLTGKHMRRSFFINKIAGCFPKNFAKFFGTVSFMDQQRSTASAQRRIKNLVKHLR